jgi:hypothetical protein
METLFNAPDGRVVGVNKRMLEFMPFSLLTNAPDTTISIPANITKGPIAMTLSGEGPAQIVSFAKQQTGVSKVFLRMQEGRTIRSLMNGFVHINTLFGDGNTPYPLPEALYIDELRRRYIEIQNLGLGTLDIRPAAGCFRAISVEADPTLVLSRKRQDFRQFLSFPYWYTFDEGAVTLTGTAVFEKTITIGGDHHFQLLQLMQSSESLFDINVTDMNTGESLIQAPLGNTYPVASEILFGDSNYPYCLMTPRLFQSGQKILIRLRNRVAGTNVVYVTLGGRAIADRLWK